MTDRGPGLGLGSRGLCSTFSSPFSLLIYRPRWLLVDPFPLSVCSQGTPKTVLSNIFALWFPEEPMKKNKASRSLHLFQLMCSRPVSLLWSCPLGEKQRAAVSQAPCGCSISLTSSQAGTAQGAAGRGKMVEPITSIYVCQFNTWRSNGAHIESCCVRVHYYICLGVYVAQHPTWSWC